MRRTLHSALGNRRSVAGFTLAEMIVVMVITAIIGGIVALFIGGPVQGYVDSSRRAALAGVADTALWRITREVRQALPNSVRVTTAGGVAYLEFIPVTGGGRYRADPAGGSGSCGGAGDDLSFAAADSCFEVMGTMPAFAAGDSLVVDNRGTAGHSAYETPATNRTAWVSNTATAVTVAPFMFPSSSSGNSFHVIAKPVTYACDPANGTLKRYWGYAIQAAQPANASAAPLVTASSALLANNVSTCSFVLARPSLLAMQLSISEGGESISLYTTAHVSNLP